MKERAWKSKFGLKARRRATHLQLLIYCVTFFGIHRPMNRKIDPNRIHESGSGYKCKVCAIRKSTNSTFAKKPNYNNNCKGVKPLAPCLNFRLVQLLYLLNRFFLNALATALNTVPSRFNVPDKARIRNILIRWKNEENTKNKNMKQKIVKKKTDKIVCVPSPQLAKFSSLENRSNPPASPRERAT